MERATKSSSAPARLTRYAAWIATGPMSSVVSRSRNAAWSGGGSARRFHAVGLSPQIWIAVAPMAAGAQGLDHAGPGLVMSRRPSGSMRRHGSRGRPDLTSVNRRQSFDDRGPRSLLTLRRCPTRRASGSSASSPPAPMPEELAPAVDLSPGTVVHHLGRLRAAGLVDAPSHPVRRVLRSVSTPSTSDSASFRRPEHAGRRGRGQACRGRTGEAPRLRRQGSQGIRGRRSAGIDPGPGEEARGHPPLPPSIAASSRTRAYPEKEVDQRLHHPDVASLRRLPGRGPLMTRGGGEYRRVVPPAPCRLRAGGLRPAASPTDRRRARPRCEAPMTGSMTP